MTVAETVSCECDYGHKMSGVPLVIVPSNDTCSNCIDLKKSQSNRKSFFRHFCFRNNQLSTKPTLSYNRTACRVEPTGKTSAIQGSLEEGVGQEQQGQGEIVCHGLTSCCGQMWAPWPRVLAVEQIKTRHGSSMIDKNKK